MTVLHLASTSPRRQALLRRAGIAFEVVAPPVAEHLSERGDPHRAAMRNARLKAMSVAAQPVLAADTVVALGDRLLGKPRDDEEARSILRALSDTTHRVVTGVALKTARGCEVCSVETRVTMRALSEPEIAAYVASGEAAGKAGAYAVQESGDRFVTHIDGPYDNVVGLPVQAVRDLLGHAGLRLD